MSLGAPEIYLMCNRSDYVRHSDIHYLSSDESSLWKCDNLAIFVQAMFKSHSLVLTLTNALS